MTPAPVPLERATVGDLIDGTTVDGRCRACGQASSVAVVAIKASLAPFIAVTELEHRLRCPGCGATGQVVVDARTALGQTG